MTNNKRAKKQFEEPLGKGYLSKIVKNTGPWKNRIIIGTPMTGLLRAEWVLARFGQIIPTNWSATDCIQWISTFAPLQYLIADAQNLIVKTAIEQKSEWLLLLESDNVLPPDAFIRFNEYMRNGNIPIVSGLYFTKSSPAEPLIYRGRGNSYYKDWKIGDLVWCDGVPTGCLLIHCSILQKMWDESSEYSINGQITRRVFQAPEKIWFDPEMGGRGGTRVLIGTSDLAWCERIIKEDFFRKAGWPEYSKKRFPFLVDTRIFVKHIDENGRMYPLEDPKTLGF